MAAGGATMAAGGVAAAVGIVFAPLTLGLSLIATVAGLGVMTAGGITSASSAIAAKVNDVNDRKKIELVAGDYLARLKHVERCLAFVQEGMRRLSGHPLLRMSYGAQAGSGWEVRRAVQMVSLLRDPADQAAKVVLACSSALSGMFKNLDSYFTVDKVGLPCHVSTGKGCCV